VVSDEPGSCPKCGMFLEPVEQAGHIEHHDHSAHGDHNGHAGHGGAAPVEGIEPQFMSMVELTEGQPRSSDGLQMEWIDVAFGPFFPGLPGGLELGFAMDGDTIDNATAGSAAKLHGELVPTPLAPEEFVARISAVGALSPVSFRMLAVRALENAAGDAAGYAVGDDVARGRVAALERERIASHLSWLSGLGVQAGFGWLAMRAAQLQLLTQNAPTADIAALAPEISALLRKTQGSRLLRARLSGIGRIDAGADAAGPVARATGQKTDARIGDKTYGGLGFASLSQPGGDALARLHQRLHEITQSLELISAAGVMTPPGLREFNAKSGVGEAVVETPRGQARLSLKLKAGKVVQARLDTPSGQNLNLINDLCAQQELGDALVAVASLDISPWEIRA
ncbi:MAG: heavy metal-binding domain-containing protein, partial [Paracoccaceae bacterium]